MYEKKTIKKRRSNLDWLSLGWISSSFSNFHVASAVESSGDRSYLVGFAFAFGSIFVRQIQGKLPYTDRARIRTTTNLKNQQRERSRSHSAGRNAKGTGKKGQEQHGENQGEDKGEKGAKEEEDEQTRHVKYMGRFARLALEMTETLMGKKCRDTAVQFTVHADLLATEIYRGLRPKRPQILLGPLFAALDAANC